MNNDEGGEDRGSVGKQARYRIILGEEKVNRNNSKSPSSGREEEKAKKGFLFFPSFV